MRHVASELRAIAAGLDGMSAPRTARTWRDTINTSLFVELFWEKENGKTKVTRAIVSKWDDPDEPGRIEVAETDWPIFFTPEQAREAIDKAVKSGETSAWMERDVSFDYEGYYSPRTGPSFSGPGDPEESGVEMLSDLTVDQTGKTLPDRYSVFSDDDIETLMLEHEPEDPEEGRADYEYDRWKDERAEKGY